MSNLVKALGTALEHRIVKRAKEKGLRSNRQPGSGMYKDLPHDAVIEDILVEAKVRSVRVTQAGKRMFSLDMDWFRRVQTDARKAGFREGILVFNAKGEARPSVVVDLDFFLELLADRRNCH